MENKYKLFLNVLKELQKEGILDEVVLIGSWCQYFYKIYFNNAPEIPSIRTVDIDFLIPRPFHLKKDVNIPEILKKYNFEPAISYTSGYIKYVNPELEIEFLTPEFGRGEQENYEIKNLHIKAQTLRFLNLLQDYTMIIRYEDITVKVPEPAVYVLQKFMVSERRSSKEKKEKDLAAAIEIGEYLLNIEQQRVRLKTVYNSLPEKWKNKIKKNVEKNSPDLFKFLL